MSVEFRRESPGKFDSRTLDRTTLSRWTGRNEEMRVRRRLEVLQAAIKEVVEGPLQALGRDDAVGNPHRAQNSRAFRAHFFLFIRCFFLLFLFSTTTTIWAFRAYPLVEIIQTILYRAIRADSISIDSILPPLLGEEDREDHHRREEGPWGRTSSFSMYFEIA